MNGGFFRCEDLAQDQGDRNEHKQLTGFAETLTQGFLVPSEPTVGLGTFFVHSSQEVATRETTWCRMSSTSGQY